MRYTKSRLTHSLTLKMFVQIVHVTESTDHCVTMTTATQQLTHHVTHVRVVHSSPARSITADGPGKQYDGLRWKA